MGEVNVSFQFKSSKTPLLPGTRASVSKSQILTSSGIVSLDHILGGGYPVGNIILIEEDEFGFYSKLFIKYFLSEGLVSRHSAYVCSLDTNTRRLVEELPSPVTDYGYESGGRSGTDDVLRIAWRYKSASPHSPATAESTAFGHHFDLACPLSAEVISSSTIGHYDQYGCYADPSSPAVDHYSRVLDQLSARTRSAEHTADSSGMQSVRRTVLRAVVHQLGSPLWTSADTKSAHAQQITRFLYRLRHLVHDSLTTCLVTVSPSLFKVSHSFFYILFFLLFLLFFSVPGLLHRCEHLSDCVISLESLARNCNPCFSDFNGLLHVTKFSTTNSLVPHVPEEVDWAFKLRKRRFAIVKLHLPPELAETEARGEQDDYAAPGCGSASGGRRSDLDF
ncbi:elongator complex protein 4 [Nilaparvata lugens]|uniref:elongator complex protein 4 n=1 Tax=Nilaparvata lugens TaxID=108931 RepID=UPI00193CB24C|nr:elongator complex protein 4 [Nilaparvata lugens]